MNVIRGILAFLGRLAISLIFLVSAAANKIPQFSNVAEAMAAEGVPQDPVLGIAGHKLLLMAAIVFLILGSISVTIGYKARVGAFMLLVFLGAATYYFHDFWNAPAEQQQIEVIQFMKNLALMGTMVFLIANGAGPGSLDRRHARSPASEPIEVPLD